MPLDSLHANVVISYCFILTACCTTFLRLYSRVCVYHQFSTDDVLIVVATAIVVAVLGLQHVMTGLFRAFISANGSFQTINPAITPMGLASLANALKFNYVGTILYLVEIGLIKLSLLAFYYRFLPPKPYHRILFWLAAAMIAVMIGTTIPAIFPCKPIAALWNQGIPGAKCTVNPSHFHAATSVFNVITDVLILVLPVSTVLQLQTDFKKKCGLIFLFSIGLIGTAITILRFVNLLAIFRVPSHMVPVWLGLVLDNIMWSQVEVGLLIACANLPGIYALWRKQPRRATITGGGSGSGSGSGSGGSRAKRSTHPFSLSRQRGGGGGGSRALGYARREGDKEGGMGTVSSAYGHLESSSAERIIQEPDAIVLSTRVEVGVE